MEENREGEEEGKKEAKEEEKKRKTRRRVAWMAPETTAFWQRASLTTLTRVPSTMGPGPPDLRKSHLQKLEWWLTTEDAYGKKIWKL